MNNKLTITPHLGTGPEGLRRKAALEAIAKRAGFMWNGKPSIGRWLCSLADKGDTKPPLAPLSDALVGLTSNLYVQELDDLNDAIIIRRQKAMATKLTANGFKVSTGDDDNRCWTNYILVLDDATQCAIFADLAECRVLLDTVRNLPPAEAFERWRKKVKPMRLEY